MEAEQINRNIGKKIKELRSLNGLTQQELASAAKLAPPSVSAALNKMEDDGLGRL